MDSKGTQALWAQRQLQSIFQEINKAEQCFSGLHSAAGPPFPPYLSRCRGPESLEGPRAWSEPRVLGFAGYVAVRELFPWSDPFLSQGLSQPQLRPESL